MGVVFIIESAGNDYTRFALSATYDRVVNFNENIQFEGNNDTFIEVTSDGQLFYEGYSSLATSFILASNYYTPNNLPLAEGFAFDTYLTDINVVDSKYYDSRYPDYTDQNPVYISPVIANNSKQIYTSNRSGISGQYNFTASLDINNKFLFYLFQTQWKNKTLNSKIHKDITTAKNYHINNNLITT
mgnify:CR=1 FL=1